MYLCSRKVWSLSLCTFYKSALTIACLCEDSSSLDWSLKTVKFVEIEQIGLCCSVNEEETDSCQEDALRRRASCIEKQSLNTKIEELCNQLITVYTNMVGSFLKAAVAWLCYAVSFNGPTLCLKNVSLIIGLICYLFIDLCIFERCFLTTFGLIVTLNFDLLTSKSTQFIFIPYCT